MSQWIAGRERWTDEVFVKGCVESRLCQEGSEDLRKVIDSEEAAD